MWIVQAILFSDILGIASRLIWFRFSNFQARDIFAQIYPDEEFLPRAPDPEDIIIEGETTTDASIVDFDAVTHEDNIKDRIEEVGDGVENTVECIEENAENETKT